MPRQSAITAKIDARKWIAIPEGKAWLAKKQEEQEKIKLA